MSPDWSTDAISCHRAQRADALSLNSFSHLHATSWGEGGPRWWPGGVKVVQSWLPVLPAVGTRPPSNLRLSVGLHTRSLRLAAPSCSSGSRTCEGDNWPRPLQPPLLISYNVATADWFRTGFRLRSVRTSSCSSLPVRDRKQPDRWILRFRPVFTFSH